MFAHYVSEMLKPLASDVQGRAIEGPAACPQRSGLRNWRSSW